MVLNKKIIHSNSRFEDIIEREKLFEFEDTFNIATRKKHFNILISSIRNNVFN